MKKLFFIIPLVISLSIMGCSTTAEQEIGHQIGDSIEQGQLIIKDVHVEEFAALIEKGEGQIVDVRTPEEWLSGIISGAIKINFYAKDFQDQITKLDKEKPVFVYCKIGGRSAQAAKQMQDAGFKQVYNLLGGITAWDDAQKELSH